MRDAQGEKGSGVVKNTLSFLDSTLAELEGYRLDPWVFGGWAAELLGLQLPRPHADIDLVVRLAHVDVFDHFIGIAHYQEIRQKRFSHKRAYLRGDVLVELFLVFGPPGREFTIFWDREILFWPADTFEVRVMDRKVASTSALATYRAQHSRLKTGRHQGTETGRRPAS